MLAVPPGLARPARMGIDLDLLEEARLNIEDLTPELKEKALACKTPEELLELAKQEGFDLSDEELQAIAGGGTGWCSYFCGSNDDF